MDEETRAALLAEFLKKKAFRDERHFSRPARLDVIRRMLRAGEAGGGREPYRYGEALAAQHPSAC